MGQLVCRAIWTLRRWWHGQYRLRDYWDVSTDRERLDESRRKREG